MVEMKDRFEAGWELEKWFRLHYPWIWEEWEVLSSQYINFWDWCDDHYRAEFQDWLRVYEAKGDIF